MQCPNCGQMNEDAVKFCPICGTALAAPAVTPEDGASTAAAVGPESAADEPAAPSPEQPAAPVPPQPSQEALKAERTAYVRQDYNPVRDGRLNIPAQPAPGAGPYAGQTGQRPSTTGMVVFSIVNMLCCGLGIGFILGVIALIYAIMAASEPNFADAQKKIGTARTLNIIGLVFIILQVILFFGGILLAVLFSRETGFSNFGY